MPPAAGIDDATPQGPKRHGQTSVFAHLEKQEQTSVFAHLEKHAQTSVFALLKPHFSKEENTQVFP